MLSAAKHLLVLIEGKQKQIPRFGRDDTVRRLFQQESVSCCCSPQKQSVKE